MASRLLADLAFDVRVQCQELLRLCANQGVVLIVTCTYRSLEEQNWLYEQGRKRPGDIVTWARAGQSLHNAQDQVGNPAARAFDVVPVRAGKAVWGTTGADLVLWQTIGKLGESLGLEWAGRWRGKKREFPHFQLKG